MATEITDKEKVNSKRDNFMGRMKTRYPEKEFADDEELFGQIDEDYEEYDNRLNEMTEREQAFSKLFQDNPRSARLMMEWKNGADPIVTLIRMYGKDELIAAIEDPERLKGIEEANKEWKEKLDKSDAMEAEFDANLPESLKALSAWAEESGKSDEEVNNVMATLSEISTGYLNGKFTKETFEMISKALNYDNATEEARMEGEVSGRNAKIEEKLRKGKRGDGMPQLGGKSGGMEEKPKRDLGALNRFDGSASDIWERGNEKRTVRRR